MSNVAHQVALEPGQVLGSKYVLDRMIGKGGMGEVWAGRNERTGKRIALKMVRRSFASNAEAAELFRLEALAASRVNHPNVVTVFDVIDHDGMTCIVMELLDGEPLNEYLAREGPLSADRAAALLLPAMRGVATANAQGVIHRDLKPHNIFLCVGADGRMVTTKVLDFGSSAMMESEVDSSTTVQLPTIGTPAYMAPEHIANAPGIDERADVYGFGVVLFEALAGQHPFPGAAGISLLTKILHGAPLPLGSLRPDLPSGVIHIVERAMAKEPSERFPNMESFIQSVEEHLLPSSSLPKNMTPLAGVPILQLSEQGSSGSNLAVPVARRTETSNIHETRALYALSGADTRCVDEAAQADAIPSRTEAEPPPVASADELSTLGRPLRRILRKTAVPYFVFGAVLAFVSWMAFHLPKPPHGVPTAPPSTPISNAPLPSTETGGGIQGTANESEPASADGVVGLECRAIASTSQPSPMPTREAAPPPRALPNAKPRATGGTAKELSHSILGRRDEVGAAIVPSPIMAPSTPPPADSVQPPIPAAELLSPPSLPTDEPSPPEPKGEERLPPSRAGVLSTDDF